MRANYTFQAVNFISTLGLLILTIAVLSPAQYLEWSLYAAVATIFLQFELSLSALSARHIARASLLDSGHASAAWAGVRKSYRKFSAFGGFFLWLFGGAYLALAAGDRFEPLWFASWTIYVGSFAIYYYFGHNAPALLALQDMKGYATVGIVSRLTYVALAFSLATTLDVLGLSFAVLFGFVVGIIGYRSRMHGKLPVIGRADVVVAMVTRDIAANAVFIGTSFLLYRVGLFVDSAVSQNTNGQASLALLLQVMTLAMTLSIVPLNSRILPLVDAFEKSDMTAASRELFSLTSLVNCAFVVAISGGAVGIYVVLPRLPGNEIATPTGWLFVAMTLAFLIELNLAVLVNALMAAKVFSFWLPYFISATTAIAVGAVMYTLGIPFLFSFIVVPMVVQTLMGLPLVYRQVLRQYDLQLRQHVFGVLGAFRFLTVSLKPRW